MNTKPTPLCEMCNLACKDSGGASLPHSLQQTPPVAKGQLQPGGRPQAKPRVNLDLKRQKQMREDGLKLIHQIRVGVCLRLGENRTNSAEYFLKYILKKTKNACLNQKKIFTLKNFRQNRF